MTATTTDHVHDRDGHLVREICGDCGRAFCGCSQCGLFFCGCDVMPLNDWEVELLGSPDEVMTEDASGARKGSKPAQLHWLDQQALLAVGKAASYGAKKYGTGYNMRLGYDWSLSYDALQRHVMAFWEGEDLDPDSNEPHMAHAAWHALNLLSYYLRGNGTDDRPGAFLATHVRGTEE